jgi:hypothetical protein
MLVPGKKRRRRFVKHVLNIFAFGLWYCVACKALHWGDKFKVITPVKLLIHEIFTCITKQSMKPFTYRTQQSMKPFTYRTQQGMKSFTDRTQKIMKPFTYRSQQRMKPLTCRTQ